MVRTWRLLSSLAMLAAVQQGRWLRLIILAQTGGLESLLFTYVLTEARDFAANVGITFRTPEEYFLNEAPHPYARQFNPNTYLNPTSTISTNTSTLEDFMYQKRGHANTHQLLWSSRRRTLLTSSSSAVAPVPASQRSTGRT